MAEELPHSPVNADDGIIGAAAAAVGGDAKAEEDTTEAEAGWLSPWSVVRVTAVGGACPVIPNVETAARLLSWLWVATWVAV